MPDPRAATRPDQQDQALHVLFFATVPPPDIKARMESAWRALGTGAALRDDRLHLSIYAAAEVQGLDPALVQRLAQTAQALRTAPFTLCLDRLRTFNSSAGRPPLVLTTGAPSREVNEIAADLHAAARPLCLAGGRLAKVTPHVTLAYGPGFSETRFLEEPIRWTIDEVVLIASPQGQGRHIHLGRWPLPKDRQQPGFDF